MKKLLILAALFAIIFASGYMYTKGKIVEAKASSDLLTHNTSSNNGQADSKGNNTSNSTTSPSNNQPVDDKTANTVNTPEKSRDEVKKPSSNGYFVKVDISEQKTYIFKGDKLFKTFICSTGIEEEETKTPRGSYIINQSGSKRGEWFYSSKYKEGAKYWVGFIGGTYLFHSVPMDANKNIILSEAEKLGTPASHGCIRLSVEDAYWLYTNIPNSTKLLIQD